MSRVTCDMAVSVDGFAAGPNQSLENPFVLTHHAREPVRMEGGTSFTFVTGGIESALAQAREAAAGGNLAIAGGVRTGEPVPGRRADRRAAPPCRTRRARRGRATARRRQRPRPRAAEASGAPASSRT